MRLVSDGFRISRPKKYRSRTKKNCPKCGTRMKGRGDFWGHDAHLRLLQCPDCGEVRLGEMGSDMRQAYLSFVSCAEEKEDEAALKYGYADWVKPSEKARTEMSESG